MCHRKSITGTDRQLHTWGGLTVFLVDYKEFSQLLATFDGMEFCHTEPLKRCLLHELWHSIIRMGQAAKESSPIKCICLVPIGVCLNYTGPVQLHSRSDTPTKFGTGVIRRKLAFIRKSYIMPDEKTTGQRNNCVTIEWMTGPVKRPVFKPPATNVASWLRTISRLLIAWHGGYNRNFSPVHGDHYGQ